MHSNHRYTISVKVLQSLLLYLVSVMTNVYCDGYAEANTQGAIAVSYGEQKKGAKHTKRFAPRLGVTS